MSNLMTSQFGEQSPSGTPLNLSLLQQQQHHQLLLQAAPPLQQSMAATGSPSQLPQQNLIMNPVSQMKRRRSLPGNPDPDAEVIALSPKSLLATNRFVCEVCGKGFQRDQNLQLHRRGHNLPWKLKQKTLPGDDAPRKKVYVCPETTCVHHDPARALGDLTGIKKHFCRKHWEKKWKCERCSKKYAVQSDWKAHVKTCGTKEYRCGCGTLFSRRDSFITHRAFCDALSEETARSMSINPVVGAGGSLALHHHHSNHPFLQLHQPSPSASSHHQHHGHHDSIMSNLTPLQTAAIASSLQQTGHFPSSAAGHAALFQELALKRQQLQLTVLGQQAEVDDTPPPSSWHQFCNPSAVAPPHHQTAASQQQQLASLDLPASLFLPNRPQDHHLSPTHFQSPAPSPHMSATALLQRAAQMGATMSHQHEPSAPNTAHLSPVAASISSATAPSSSGFSLGLSSPHDTGGSSLTSFGHDFSSQPQQVVHDMVVMASMAAHQSAAEGGAANGFGGGAQFDVDGIGRMLGIKRENHHMVGRVQGSSTAARERVQMNGGGGGGSDGMTRDFLGLRGLYPRDIHGIVGMDPNSGAPTSFEQAQQQMEKQWN